MATAEKNLSSVIHDLEIWFDVEFSFLNVEPLAEQLLKLPAEDRDFLLDWTRRISTTNTQIAYQFALNALKMITRLDRNVVEAWALQAMDSYDRSGLHAALKVVHDIDHSLQLRHEHAAGVVFDEVSAILFTFARGLSGRRLRLEQGEQAYTDSETIYLPAVVAHLESANDNFQLCKAMVAMFWAQTRFGTFRADLIAYLQPYADSERAVQLFHSLETLRLEACIARELPGLYRAMLRLKQLAGEAEHDPVWRDHAERLGSQYASVQDSLDALAGLYERGVAPLSICYQGAMRPDLVAECMAARITKEKALLRVKLAALQDELRPRESAPDTETEADKPARFELKTAEDKEGEPGAFDLLLDDVPIAPPQDVRQLLISVRLDFGEIPPEYLVAAGPGEYDLSQYDEKQVDPDEVWQGTYHEEGATFYSEWDYGRQHYRKNWCVMREKDVTPIHDDFVATVLNKYLGQVKHLRKTFEMMRDENRLLKRQTQGDDVDIDSLVEALADVQAGQEMSDRLFTRMHRVDRNIAVAFMVDMSGSTKGWINEAEREALVMLCEALETLGDRYAIYGFSGLTRKRCELFRIKRFDEHYTDEVKSRISGIRPQEYTRMGFAIRHLSKLLNEVEARTKLLITLSDGRPDDYFDVYRGQHGIEDTRMALLEAKRQGVHSFCITIDKEARDYLPHMYGHARYTILDNVQQLPRKVADIYRRITT
jgi:nitric oxide reductase NorD protein